MNAGAANARNYTQCDSLLMGDTCGAHTFPYIEVKNNSAKVEHEATTSKVSDDQIFYCRQRGMSEEDAVNLIVNGFAKGCSDSFRWSLRSKRRSSSKCLWKARSGRTAFGRTIIEFWNWRDRDDRD